MRRLAWALLPFCTAIFLAVYLVPDDWHWTGGAACLIFSPLAFFFHGKKRMQVLFVTLGLWVGFSWCALYQMIWCAPARAYIGQTKAFSACVVDVPQKTKYGASVTVQIQPKTGQAFRACLYLNEGYQELKLGDPIFGIGNFTTAEVIHDREASYYTAKGIHVLGKKIQLNQLTHPKRIPWNLYPLQIAQWLQKSLDALYQGDSGGLLKALTTGERSGMSDSFRTALSRDGLSHMTAVSGMHMVFLVELILLLPGNRRWKSLVAIPVMFGFALLTGAAPSVMRAAVMESFLLLGPVLRRQYDPITALSAALFLLLVQNPWAAGSMGLQLSFTSVAGIYLLFPKILGQWQKRAGESQRRQWVRRHVWNIKKMAALTLSAMAFTIPLTVAYFDTVSVIAPISNLLIIWCVSLMMSGGFLTAILYGICPILGILFSWPVNVLTWYVITVVKGLASLPFAALNGNSPWIRLWLLMAYVLLAFVCLRKPKGLRAAVPVVGTICILGLALWANRATMLVGDLTTAVLDVGQGQCVVLISRNEAIAVDCGGHKENAAGDELADYLNQLGIFQLKLLVLTHYDSDHINGVNELLERMKVGTIAAPDVEDDSGNRERIETEAKQHHVKWERITSDRTKTFGEARAQLFAPVSGESDNEACISVLTSANDFDVLITGDMDSQMEEQLVRQKQISQVEVLVAGHHGSRYSTSEKFLKKIEPQVGVISVGDNSYGHPTQETLDRLKQANIDIYRTDLNGTVTIKEH